MADDGHQPTPVFADVVNELFDTVVDKNGLQYTNKKLTIKANGLGYRITESYISLMRKGRVLSPSFRTVEALASSFEVSVTRFVADADADRRRGNPRRHTAPADGPAKRPPAPPDPDFSVATIDTIIALLETMKNRRLNGGPQ